MKFNIRILYFQYFKVHKLFLVCHFLNFSPKLWCYLNFWLISIDRKLSNKFNFQAPSFYTIDLKFTSLSVKGHSSRSAWKVSYWLLAFQFFTCVLKFWHWWKIKHFADKHPNLRWNRCVFKCPFSHGDFLDTKV